MEEFDEVLNDQRDLLDSLQRRIAGQTPFIEFDKLHAGTFMSRYYLTNCLEQKWLNPFTPDIQELIWDWASGFPEFFAKARRHGWIREDEKTDELTLRHACDQPHRYTLHFLLEGWLSPQHPKVKELITLTLNEGNSNIYLDKGWLTEAEVSDILDNYSF